MLFDVFVLPSSGKLVSNAGFNRLVKSITPDVCFNYTLVASFADINQERKNRPFFGVFFDNEYFDSRLSKSLRSFLIYARGIDMFTVFIYRQGADCVLYQPRIFSSQLKLNPDKRELPLPVNERELVSEKILNGWVYRD